MKEKTDLDGVKFVAKQLVMVDIHLTEYSPIVVQHPFTSSGIAATPSEDGLRLLDITKSEEDLRAWQGYMKGLIDNAKSAYEIYMMVNKPYGLTFLRYWVMHGFGQRIPISIKTLQSVILWQCLKEQTNLF